MIILNDTAVRRSKRIQLIRNIRPCRNNCYMKWKISSVAGLLKFTSALTIIRMKEWRKMEIRFGQLIAFLESAHGEFLNVCINLRSARVVRTCLYFSNSPIDFLPLCLCQFMPVDMLFTFPLERRVLVSRNRFRNTPPSIRLAPSPIMKEAKQLQDIGCGRKWCSSELARYRDHGTYFFSR